MAYEKLLNEIYAAVSLKYLWKEYQPYFVKSEYLFLHPTDENDIDAGALFEYMRFTQATSKKRFDWVFLECYERI
ncbi:MAG: hypothetical protein UIC64_00185 [Agathobacter sp.]|nr:hypothetical protein [Agathobacter sp.]